MGHNIARREFLKRAGSLSLAGVAAPFALNLAAFSEAAAASATDYKALVCVFLGGGNDYANTVVTYDALSHAEYVRQRPAIAIGRDKLTALAPTIALPDGRQYALAPGLEKLGGLFDAGKMAVMLNLGTLVQPTTKQQYLDQSVPLPPKLFSHNDQKSIWQSLLAEGSTSGWGGRMCGLLDASGNNGDALFTSISVAGDAVFLAGGKSSAYQIAPTGSVRIAALKSPLFGSGACSDALREMLTAQRTNWFESDLSDVYKQSIAADVTLSSTLDPVTSLSTKFPANNSLASQLAMVARLIKARQVLGKRRQVFFVSLGGFDTHNAISTVHPGLISTVSEAMAAFYDATVEMGVADSVTTFTASDFGRTMNSDGDGSDHGWGSMHFVVGGAVKGKSFHGKAPIVANGGENDVGRGRLLPDIAVDQFAASLAGWFGVSKADIATIIPNINNYTTQDLGFMGVS